VWILVIDNDDDLRAAFGEALADSGLRSRQAKHGREGLDVIRQAVAAGDGPPAGIVLDLVMPHLDGWGFAQQLDADASLRGVPIIIATAFGHLTKAHALRFGSLPPPPVVAKPYDLNLMVERLLDVCGVS